MKTPRSILGIGSIVLIGLSLSACSKNYSDEENGRISMETEKILSESSMRAASAQEELARIQTARTTPAPRPVEENLAGVPEELRRPATLEWSGPGEEAAREIARILGWQFRVVGNPPATPPMVNVNQRDVAIAKILENIGLQTQPFAQIVAVSSEKRIEFRFLTDRNGLPTTTRPTSREWVTK